MKYGILLVGILLFLCTGCSSEIKGEEQFIRVEKWVGVEEKYELFREIKENVQVQKVKEILESMKWENAEVSMEHPPEYRFYFQFKNPEIQAKPVLYELWISPNNDKLELVIDARSKYVQLDKEKSKKLFEILIGG